MRVCTASGPDWTCNHPHHARGYCARHYRQAHVDHVALTPYGYPQRRTQQHGYATRAADIIEEVQMLVDAKTPPICIGPAVGKTPQALYRFLFRWGRKDLASYCNPNRVAA